MPNVPVPEDPRRCQCSDGDHQCNLIAAHGSQFCTRHGGRSNLPAEVKRQYMLTDPVLAQQVADFTQHDSLKSLREEMGIIKAMIQRKVNQMTDDASFLASIGPINTLTNTLEKLAKTTDAMEARSGTIINRQAVIQFAQKICQAIVDRLECVPNYESIVDGIIADVKRILSETPIA